MVFLGVYRAIYDYVPQSDEELEIKDGDLLFVLDKSADDDWWKAKKKAASDDEDEPEGLIPANYVEEAKPEYKAKALYDYAQQTDEELTFREEAQLDVYDTSDPDWTLVGLNGVFGFAPAIYIEPASSANAQPPAAVEEHVPSLPSRPRPAVDESIPGESDYADHGMTEPSANNPAAALAGIIAQRTGGADAAPAARRQLASPPAAASRQYTPEESEEDAPSLPQRPRSQAASPTVAQSQTQYAPPRFPAESAGVQSSPPYNRDASSSYPDDNDSNLWSPGGFHLYNVHEMVSHMGKNKKMPTTLGINVGRGLITISPEKSRDGPSHEWTAEKLTHYSIEGKHVFVELVRPSKSVDFHAGAKDTAQEIVSQLGDLAGAVRQEGLREVIAASAGTGGGGQKKGQMLCEFMAQGEDEVTVAVGDEVLVLDDVKSDDWWLVRRLKTGKEGVVPASYIEVTGVVGNESISGLNAARSTVEQNRIEEQRLAREAMQKDKRRSETGGGRNGQLPERGSSLSQQDTERQEPRRRTPEPASTKAKTKPNSSRVRTWTDRSGTFKVDAEFIGLREGKIHLHKLNGVKIAVPVTKMAVEDLEYVEKATGVSLDEDKPLSDIRRRSTQKPRDQRNGGSSRTPAAGATVTDKEQEQWFDFFLQCGVNPQICERYASAFAKDQMGQEVLPDVNEQLLRTLGLKEGDILRVMKHLDEKYGRAHNGITGPPSGDANGGLFSGPGGALRNNTRKGRPAPAVETSDVVDDSAFKPREVESAKETALANAPRRQPNFGGGFDDDAWDVKPGKGQALATPAPALAPSIVEPPRPALNDDLSLLALPLQPQPTAAASMAAPAPAPQAQAEVPAQPSQPQGAEQAIFDKIAALSPQPTAPPRQRPPPPITQPNGSSLGVPPPPRAASAPGFPPQQSTFGPPPLQPQLTGYQQPMQTGYQQQMPPGYGLAQGMQQGFPPMPGFAPQQTGFQYSQQPNGMNMMPQVTGMVSQQQGLINGAQTGSPFADPSRQAYQPAAPSGLAQSFGPPQQQGNLHAMQQNYPALAPQPTGYQPQSQFGQSQMLPPQATGYPQQQQAALQFPQQSSFQQQQQPSFNISQPTGLSSNASFGQPAAQLPPQQTGGVLGPMQPLVPQKTGPAPPVRFGLGAGKPIVPQRTGRADLGRATPQNPFGF